MAVSRIPMTPDQVAALRADLLDKAIANVLATADGVRVMLWVLGCCKVYQDAFSSSDSATNFVVGKQSVGKELIARIGASNGLAYPQLLAEAVKQELAFDDLYEMAGGDE